MKPFRFRLQAVLTLREHAEQLAQRQFARAFAAAEKAAARVKAAEAQIDAAEQVYRGQLAASPRAAEVEHLRVYALLLHERRVQSARELAEARRRGDEAWRQLMVATQRRDALERLRKRQSRAHHYVTAHHEQRVLDELSLSSKVQSLKSLEGARLGFGPSTLDSRL